MTKIMAALPLLSLLDLALGETKDFCAEMARLQKKKDGGNGLPASKKYPPLQCDCSSVNGIKYGPTLWFTFCIEGSTAGR